MKNNAEKKMIEQIQTYRFEIPPYQRLYAWGETEINTLLDDMKKAHNDNKKEYFIGNITTSIDKDDKDKFVLINGQQRLTTLWFIGFYLASQNCPNWKEFIMQGENLRIAMPIRDNEQNSLTNLAKKIVDGKHKFEQDKDGKVNLFKELQNIHQKIVEAFSCIELWFKNIEKIKENEIKDFAQYIYAKVCFVFVTLAQKTDLNRFFVRMNNRGKQLEKHEILKVRILHKIDEGERDQYAKIWNLCSDMDKYIFQSSESETYQVESIIDFPTFLLHCYKLWVAKKYDENKIPKAITITKDKLLEIMWENKDSDKKEILCDEFIFDSKSNAKQNCKEFIIYMLRYRVLFDGFVIKFTAKTDKDINDKESSYKIKRLDSNGKYIVDSGLKDLEMVQNYLRVARRGTNQNYEHWLTDFLRFLVDNKDEQEINEIKNFGIMRNFLEQNNEIKNKLIPPQCLIKQKDDSNDQTKQNPLARKLVEFLEKMDTRRICEVNIKDKKIEDISKDFLAEHLSHGTATPHYWFYRLEYYLWKWGKDDNGKNLVMFENEKSKIYNTELGESKNKVAFKDIFTKNLFHFRILGSIEHFSARQRKEPRKQWDKDTLDELDAFGNLALISQNLNSSLSNELENSKKDEVINQLKRGRLESLKYFIMCANLKSDEWTYENAKNHQEQMLEILKQSLEI